VAVPSAYGSNGRNEYVCEDENEERGISLAEVPIRYPEPCLHGWDEGRSWAAKPLGQSQALGGAAKEKQLSLFVGSPTLVRILPYPSVTSAGCWALELTAKCEVTVSL
jgi:hypothetical protein